MEKKNTCCETIPDPKTIPRCTLSTLHRPIFTVVKEYLNTKVVPYVYRRYCILSIAIACTVHRSRKSRYCHQKIDTAARRILLNCESKIARNVAIDRSPRSSRSLRQKAVDCSVTSADGFRKVQHVAIHIDNISWHESLWRRDNVQGAIGS